MKRILPFLLALLVTTSASAQYALQFGSAVAVSGDDVIVGEGRNLLEPGNVYVYSPAVDGSYALSATLRESDDGADGFGQAVAGYDGTIVVGAPVEGTVYVYAKQGGAWTRTAAINTDQPGFGSTLAFAPGHLLVGTPGGRGESGWVSAFRSVDGGEWSPAGEFQAPEPSSGDGFGQALAISGQSAAIGAPGTDERQGLIQTLSFDAESASWKAGEVVRHPAPNEGDAFGSSVLTVGDYLVAGTPGRDARSGSVVVFKRDQTSGSLELHSRLSPFSARSGESFGTSVAYVGEARQLLVGAPGLGAREGGLFVFQGSAVTDVMTGTSLEQPAALQFRSGFGGALAANSTVAVIGAAGQDNFEGVAYVYVREGDTWGEPQLIYHDSGLYESVTGSSLPCEDDVAGEFSCSEVDMVSFLSRYDIGARRGIQVNDVWGWEHGESGREFALIGRTDGTSFVELTDPSNPVFLGDLPKTSTANQSLWRDVKVYRDHAFIVADGAGAHHVQIFDLRRLLDVPSAPVEFEETAIYKGVFSSHNIVINEESGFAYAVGSDSGGESCGGALHMIDVRDPANPTFAGCFSDRRTGRGGSGATHDAQCVTYRGPDADYTGREICLSSNGTALSIADVTDKSNPTAISIAQYPNVAYTHQGWLSEDHRYFYLNDEGDEVSELVDATRTLIFDLAELEDPVLANEYFAEDSAIDHNLYIRDNLMYQTNYQAGLRIIDIADPENPVEVGYFDTVPYGPNDNSPVLGAWSSYPYFKSGVIVVTSGREGVFFLKKRSVDT